MTTGGVRCWGYGTGALGDGTTTDFWSPHTTDVLGGVAAIAAGENHTCALMTTGGVRCWGDDYWGQLGDGTMWYLPTPTPVVWTCD
jgi:alpha-tubulin suppressor-like RCC1 family protein